MSDEQNKEVGMFGDLQAIVKEIATTVSTLCKTRGWKADTLAARAFPATAKSACSGGAAASAEFARILEIAEGLVSGSVTQLPSKRFLLAFLDALEAPVQTVVAPQLTQEAKAAWFDSLNKRGLGQGFGAEGRPFDMAADAGCLDLMLALDALSLVCEPEPAPSLEEVMRRTRIRNQVNEILHRVAT
ncbi:MAG TPA: hypothetical protein VG326_03630 [Tepidisphaeraceae bacterium]|jgi:hypothetical protein|nr:hypothetical protein [Tepidisphaeraceae bacterium]